MSNGKLVEIHDREVKQLRRSTWYTGGLIALIAFVIAAIGFSVR